MEQPLQENVQPEKRERDARGLGRMDALAFASAAKQDAGAQAQRMAPKTIGGTAVATARLGASGYAELEDQGTEQDGSKWSESVQQSVLKSAVPRSRKSEASEDRSQA